jgi:hypothetical protein
LAGERVLRYRVVDGAVGHKAGRERPDEHSCRQIANDGRQLETVAK